ncbi:MAG: outer membrane beta-barrel protein [bacterium]
MLKKISRLLSQTVLAAALLIGLAPAAHADTQARQFVLNLPLGVAVGNEGLGASFDVGLEPEFFFTEHTSLGLRLEGTVGDTDTFHVGARFRYYFDIGERVNIFVGAGMGFVANFDGADFGDAAIPVFGWQYDVTKHFKIGSDVSFDIVFNDNNVAFLSRLMPVVVKWAF